jgi:hypothetical protein
MQPPPRIGDPDLAHELESPVTGSGPLHASMHLEDLADLVPDAHDGIER